MVTTHPVTSYKGSAVRPRETVMGRTEGRTAHPMNERMADILCWWWWWLLWGKEKVLETQLGRLQQ